MDPVTPRPRPRFKIKVATWPTANPIVLVDAARPAYRGAYPTLARACLAMDNIVRRERHMPARIDWQSFTPPVAHVELPTSTPERRLANLLEGRTATVRVEAVR